MNQTLNHRLLNPADVPSDAWELLSPHISEARRNKMLKVASHRSRYLRLVLQDVQDPHNIAACLRSAEAFGLTHVDIINLKSSRLRTSSVSKGSRDWLKVTVFDNITDCVKELRAQSLRLLAGMPPEFADQTGIKVEKLEDVSTDSGIALLFGNEQNGISQEWFQHVDEFFTIPMYGFVESLNISVSAAVSMHELSLRMKRSLKDQYFLTAEEQNSLLGEWICLKQRSWKGLYQQAKKVQKT